jgi:hypothetical protein
VILLKEEVVNTLRFVLEMVAVVLIVLLTIGLFNTPFQDGKAIMMNDELMAERTYVEKMTAALDRFSKQVQEINETNKLSQEGKIVPMKISQIYSEIFNEMQSDYEKYSYMEVPERFRQFHTYFIESMELQGASMNEVLTYLKDNEPAHLVTVEKYNQAFEQKYENTINLFNRLLEEKKLK